MAETGRVGEFVKQGDLCHIDRRDLPSSAIMRRSSIRLSRHSNGVDAAEIGPHDSNSSPRQQRASQFSSLMFHCR
jgi:hypothetical protein